MILIKLCLIIICVTYSSQTRVKFIDEEELQKITIDSNAGIPVAPGYHAHSVLFIYKPTTSLAVTKDIKRTLQGDFLCSGTIVNRRYALTRASCIASYPLGSYWMVSQHEIFFEKIPNRIKLNLEMMNLIEIDFVVLHPAYDDSIRNDLALVRTAKDLNFSYETRNVNTLIGPSINLDNCKLVVWSLFLEKDAETKFNTLRRAEMPFKVTSENCANNDSFICLWQEKLKYQPCGLNDGAPLLCNSILVGIYIGNEGFVDCDGRPLNTYLAMRVDHGIMRNWLEEVLTERVLLKSTPEINYFEDSEGAHEVTLATCPAP